jgi:hypothetical protein
MATALANSRWVPKGLYDRAIKTLGHVGITDVITLALLPTMLQNLMCEIVSAKPSLRVLQCVDPSAGLRFSVHSRIRASKAGVSLLGRRPAW